MKSLPHEHEGLHAIGDEHARLDAILESLRQTLAARQTPPPRIAAMISELGEHLADHFLHEEEGGYFAEVIELAPRLSDRVDGLLGEHRELSAQLDRMHQRALLGEDNSDWWEALEDEFAQFCDRFHAHEAAENVLVQEAYADDIGVKD